MSDTITVSLRSPGDLEQRWLGVEPYILISITEVTGDDPDDGEMTFVVQSGGGVPQEGQALVDFLTLVLDYVKEAQPALDD